MNCRTKWEHAFYERKKIATKNGKIKIKLLKVDKWKKKMNNTKKINTIFRMRCYLKKTVRVDDITSLLKQIVR